MSVLSKLSVELEAVTSEWEDAEHACALAENEYNRVWSVANLKAEADGNKSVAACERIADLAAVEQKAAWRLAEATFKSVDRRWRSIEKRLSAAQSHNRMIERQT